MRSQSLSLGGRRAAARLVAGLMAALLALGVTAKEPRKIIRDPHYGDGLFYFFQTRYFTSVTNLMVSQHFERMPNHVDEAEVLRGGLFLSYGLHREAGDIFARLIEKGAPPAIRDRAWFYLAKIRYQRGLLAEAEDAIGRIENNLPPDLAEERALLHANLLMTRQDFAGAAKLLDEMAAKESKKGPSQYVRFNLGVALIKSGDATRGTALLDELGRAPATSEEFRTLRDKANVALGFAALQANDGKQARVYLERVRLSGMPANKALLGFGWAAAAQNQPKVALVPWMELAKRDPADAAVLEAKLAVPYALSEVGAYAQSLELYNQALDLFRHEGENLDESIAAIRAGKLLSGLLARNPGEEMGWFWNITELPEMPHAGHLAPVLAQHEFQEAFKNYRDLKFLENNLQQWQNKLIVLNDMLANRRQAFAERLPAVHVKQRAADIEGYEQRHAELAAELTRVESESDAGAFATAKERDLQERLDRVREGLSRAPNTPELNEARERYRRVAGAMSWQLADQFAARLWEAKKAIKAVEELLAEARARDAALAAAQQDEPARLDAFAARIAELDQRVQALLPRVVAVTAEQQHYVQELAVAELEAQKERLTAYTTHARFSVAQIYDRAEAAKERANAAVR
ncbi:MAG TPA: hypothetical protein VFR86_04105 [Burkholderiaceae bacterium]|nr:hypothetical protein [Burkholderiaceae bacterium]